MKPAFMTAFGERRRPRAVNIHESPNAKDDREREGGGHAGQRRRPGRKPRITPSTMITVPATR